MHIVRSALACTLALVTGIAAAGVVRIEVESSAPFADGKSFGGVGPYVRIKGRFAGELDPARPANKAIVDLGRAPKNERGFVEYSADFDILTPADKSKGNGTLFYDVNNRGNKRLVHLLNDVPGNNALNAPEHAGDGFLMRNGFTVVWSGWIPGLPKAGNVLRLDVPNAKGIEQPVWDEFLFNDAKTIEARLSFAAATVDKSKARLTVRDRNEDSPSVIHDKAWEFADGNTIRLLPNGTPFRRGALYQLTYRAKDPPVAGIGYAATRDLIAFLRYGDKGNPLAGATKVAIAHGTSQSGRYLRDMLYNGFNEAEDGRPIFDGMNPHIASARLFLNYRFAQPNRAYTVGYGFLGYPDASFPHSYAKQKDPISGKEDGLLERCSARKNCPKIIQTITATEYWQGGHSLNTTDPLGQQDIALPDNVRIYYLAGTQHVIQATMPKGVCSGEPNTAIDPRPAMRALVLALDRWVKSGATPPASAYPKIADKTLVPAYALKWPQVPGLMVPRGPNPMLQFDYGKQYKAGVIDAVPPALLKARYVALVPAIDADGNETGGIRMPEQAVPFATSTGWSVRTVDGGSAGELCYLDGMVLPFAPTAQARETTKDPRLSLAERYKDKDDYLAKVRDAANALQAKGYLLAEDVDGIVQRAEKTVRFETPN
ncbi:MAG TPA: alpha/beta hydrolase domain-containing protein [Burkholderiales bacterium]|nr:alpha/beta hydrolase domain-containing protein [Burkholderiales bacterium]